MRRIPEGGYCLGDCVNLVERSGSKGIFDDLGPLGSVGDADLAGLHQGEVNADVEPGFDVKDDDLTHHAP